MYSVVRGMEGIVKGLLAMWCIVEGIRWVVMWCVKVVVKNPCSGDYVVWRRGAVERWGKTQWGG